MKKFDRKSRRTFLNYITLIFSWAGLGLPAFASSRISANEVIKEINLEKQTTAALFDIKTKRILDSYNEDLKLPVASVVKAVTAVYGIEVIGNDFTFSTDLFTDGKVKNGRLEGNLYFIGGGDPSLSSVDLQSFVDSLKDRGIKKISGNFFYNSNAIPDFLTIDPSQLPQESFNPGFSALNLNQNKILFSWEKKGNNYDLELEARYFKSRASVSNISIIAKEHIASGFEYSFDMDKRTEIWAVSKGILKEKGMRWLPVRFSSEFASSALHLLLKKNGVDTPYPIPSNKNVPGLILLFRHHSKNLSSIAKEMLDRSTNVTAEIIGVFAANFWALPTPNIMASGLIMTKWFNFVSKTAGNKFVNHSGLTVNSRVSSLDFTKFLSRDETMETLVPLLKERKIYSLKTGKLISPAVRIVAKTGTMYFNRGLAGYVIKNGVPCAAFAIFSADLQKRDSIPKVQFSRPPGSKKWLHQAKNLERNILINWIKNFI